MIKKYSAKRFLSITIHAIIIFMLAFSWLAALPAQPALAYAGEYAITFDGVDDYVNLGLTTTLMGSYQWHYTKSISVWIRPTGPSQLASNNDVARMPQIVGNNARWFGIARGIRFGVDAIWIWNYDGDYGIVQVPYTIGEWTHITLVHNAIDDVNGTLYAYKNGELVGTATSGRTQDPRYPPLFLESDVTSLTFGGVYAGTAPGYFQGQIDDLALWDTPIDQEAIRAYMYRGLDASHPYDANLQAYYRMTEGSGEYVLDNSGNNHTGLFDCEGTACTVATWSTSSALAGPGDALAFDGTDDYVEAASPLDLSAAAGLTIEAWINPADISTNPVSEIFRQSDSSSSQDFGLAFQDNGSTLSFSLGSGATYQELDVPISPIDYEGQWRHVAAVYDGSTQAVYIDGEMVGAPLAFTGPINYTASARTCLAAFCDTSSQSAHFAGQIDEVRIWNTARNQDQIRQTMHETLQGNDANLAAYYRFDQFGGTTLYDIKADKHGALTNMEPASDWVASSAFNTWIGVENTQWSNAANWSQNAVPTSVDNVGLYAYPLNNIAVFGGAVQLDDFYLGEGQTIFIMNGGSLTVANKLNNYGTLILNRSVTAAGGEVSFFDTGGYGGVLIDPNGSDLGSTEVKIRGNHTCTEFNTAMNRCFEINPTTLPGASGAKITFFFDSAELNGINCSDVNAYHFNGVGWDLLVRDATYGTDGRSCAVTPYSVKVEGVTAFSPFALRGADAPTVVSLLGFEAASNMPLALPLILGTAFLTLTAFVGILIARRKKAVR